MEVGGEDVAIKLLEFRAGLMNMTGGVLAADPRKGLLVVARTEDTLTHILWYPRQGAAACGPAEHDIVVFPEECQLQQIPGQARCWVLEFKDDPSRNMFFWMQQVKQDEDASLVSNFNRAVNGLEVQQAAPAAAPPPQQPPAAPPATQQRAAPPAGSANDMAALLRAALSGAAPQSTPGAINPTALAASLLSQLAGGQGQRQRPVDEGPGLHEVLKPELLAPLMQLPGMLEKLAPHLPEEHRTESQLVATVRSPQFQQQLATFSAAMQTGQLDLTQFGLQPKGFSVADFLTAVQELADRERQQQAGAAGSGAQQEGPAKP